MASGQTQEILAPQDGLWQTSYPVDVAQDQGVLVAAYPALAEGWLVFVCVLNNQYGGGSVNVTIAWICPGNTGVVKWGAAVFRMNSGLVYATPSWGTESSQAVTVPGVAGSIVYTTLTLTSAKLGGLRPGEIYQLRIRRDVSPPSNSLSAAQLLGVVVSEA